MSNRVLYIEIFQPFAQYRNPFTFYYAQTYPLPPKSTIIGMLQNAIGDWYGNTHGDSWWNLKVSVHGGFESVFWNYQRLIEGEIEIRRENGKIRLYNDGLPLYNEGIESQRSPVYQQELFNGHLYIFIKSENDELLDEIKNSLENPKKVLYLGRSEDIIFIKDVKEIKNDVDRIKVKESVKLTYPTYILAEGFPIKNKKYPVYFIPVKVIFENNGKRVKHKAEINKNTERKVEFKSVIYTRYNSTIILKKEECKEGIEVEIYRIGNKEIMIFEKWGWI